MNTKNYWKIVEKEDHSAVHSVGYYGDEGKKRAQARIDKGECIPGWINKKAQFEVIPSDY